jgi:fibronectin-binding autotransporter adhesin
VQSTFTVNSVGDSPTGIGSNDAGDLRYCINQANADNQANTIVFDSTVFSTPQTITLSGTQLELQNAGGTQTITGPAAGVTISGGGTSRVFQVDPGVTASISGLTISGGSWAGPGGGMANYGTATLTDCTVSGNSSGRANSSGSAGGECSISATPT